MIKTYSVLGSHFNTFSNFFGQAVHLSKIGYQVVILQESGINTKYTDIEYVLYVPCYLVKPSRPWSVDSLNGSFTTGKFCPVGWFKIKNKKKSLLTIFVGPLVPQIESGAKKMVPDFFSIGGLFITPVNPQFKESTDHGPADLCGLSCLFFLLHVVTKTNPFHWSSSIYFMIDLCLL